MTKPRKLKPLMPEQADHIGAGAFKAHCLRLIDQVAKSRRPLRITKHGRVVAQLVPIDETPHPLFGSLKDSVTVQADIVESLGEKWDAEN